MSANDLNDRFVGVKPDAQVAHAESSSGDCIVSADEQKEVGEDANKRESADSDEDFLSDDVDERRSLTP